MLFRNSKRQKIIEMQKAQLADLKRLIKPKEEVKIKMLDYTIHSYCGPILLDGKGNLLNDRALPVYLEFTMPQIYAGLAVNSKGEPYDVENLKRLDSLRRICILEDQVRRLEEEMQND